MGIEGGFGQSTAPIQVPVSRCSTAKKPYQRRDGCMLRSMADRFVRVMVLGKKRMTSGSALFQQKRVGPSLAIGEDRVAGCESAPWPQSIPSLAHHHSSRQKINQWSE